MNDPKNEQQSDPIDDPVDDPSELNPRPWLTSYAEGVPHSVEIPDHTLDQLLQTAAARWPDRVAVDFFGATLTFAELRGRVERSAAGLRALGVRPGDVVSLVLPNCSSHVVAFHAVQACGAVVAEHNPTYSAAELREQFNLTGSTVAIVWRNRVADVREAGGAGLRVISVDLAEDLPRKARLLLRLPISAAKTKRAALTGGDDTGAIPWSRLLRRRIRLPRRLSQPVSSPVDTALILFTGGTTGVPKAAELSHRNLMGNALQGQAWAPFGEGTDVVFGMLPFFHAFGMLFCVVLPPVLGATLVAFPNFDPPAVLAAQRRRPATFVPGVAPMFGRILDQAAAERRRTDFSSVTLAFSGAMPLGREVAEGWEKLTGGLLIEGYGMTETSPIALGNPCTPSRRPGALGIPFPDTEIRVTPDGSGEAVPDERGVVRGELSIRGPQVFKGYLRHPEETAKILDAEGWLRTGDIVEMDEAGFVTLVDRVKEMIVVGGYKVFPSQVEDWLRQMPAVEDVAVVGLPREDSSDEQVLAVIVVTDGHQAPSLNEVRSFAAERLPSYAVPRKLDVIDELPRSIIGKVLRRVVREEYLAKPES